MPLTITCPDCQTTLRIREEYLGKKVKCPKCGASVTAGEEPIEAQPVDEPVNEGVTTGRPAAERVTAGRPPAGSQRCPECGELIPAEALRCKYCKAMLDEPPEDRIRRPSPWKPCPKCGATGAERVTWTPWGSFYGPAMFNHVRCPGCGYKYNGRTGGSNMVVATIFVLIPAALILGLLAFLVLICLGTFSGNSGGYRGQLPGQASARAT